MTAAVPPAPKCGCGRPMQVREVPGLALLGEVHVCSRCDGPDLAPPPEIPNEEPPR